MRNAAVSVFLSLVLGLASAVSAAAADPIVPVQWPGAPGFPPGPPGPPGPPPGPPGPPGGPPGWPGPGAGPAWMAHQQYCERMSRRLERIRQRVQWSPPWVRDRLGFEAGRIDARLRRQCWGR